MKKKTKIPYKIREERNGAMLFDNEKGAVTGLTEKQYREIVDGKNDDFGYLYDAAGIPLFALFHSHSPRTGLPEDCVSAPSKVYFEITRRCNLFCKHCYNGSGRDFPEEIKKETVFSIIDELYRFGTFEIRLTGGEPTLHSGFFSIVEYAADRDFFISLGTNGVWSDELIDRVLDSEIKTVIVSLDGPEEFNDYVRGKGTYRSVTHTIDRLKRNRGKSLKMNSVLCKENIRHIDEIVDTAEALGFDGLNIAPLHLSGRAGSSEFLSPLDPADMHHVVSRVTAQRSKKKIKIQTYYDILEAPLPGTSFPASILNKKSCAAGIEVAAISPRGEVYGCVVSPANSMSDENGKKLFVAGNIGENSFIDIWLDSQRWQAYRNLKLNKSDKCLVCGHYSKSCFGNCVVDSFAAGGKLNSPSPLCFADLLGAKP